jgi:hypothetical protein
VAHAVGSGRSGAAAGRLDRLVHDRRIEPRLGHLAAGLGDPGRQLFPTCPRRRLPELVVRVTAQQDRQWLAMFSQPDLIAGGRLSGSLTERPPPQRRRVMARAAYPWAT